MDFELCFPEPVVWDVAVLSQDFASWLATEDTSPRSSSLNGILSSLDCERLLRTLLDHSLCMDLRILIETSSLLLNQDFAPHPTHGRGLINMIRSEAGASLLKSLEVALKASALAQASREKAMGLFLVLLGTVVSIAYTHPQDLSGGIANFDETRHELIRILTHYMVFLGERLDLLKDNESKERILRTCQNLWHKIGSFKWDDSLFGPPLEAESDAHRDQSVVELNAQSFTPLYDCQSGLDFSNL